MPQGKGTYGNTMGRPPKKKMMARGGKVGDRKTYDAERAKMDAIIKEKQDELKRLRTGYEKDKVYKEYLESYRKEENDPTNAGRKLYRFLDEVGDGIRQSPIGILANKMGTGTFSKDDAAQMRARKEVKGYKSGGKVKKKMMAGGKVKAYKDGGLAMVTGKDGKKVPFYAADGKGKMKAGGKVKKMMAGGKVKKNMGGKIRGYGMARGGRVCKMR